MKQAALKANSELTEKISENVKGLRRVREEISRVIVGQEGVWS